MAGNLEKETPDSTNREREGQGKEPLYLILPLGVDLPNGGVWDEGMSAFHGPGVTNSTTLNHIFQSNIVSITTQ